RIGSMKTNGSAQWVKFVQVGDEFLLDASVTDVNTTASNTPALVTLGSVPTGVQVIACVRGYWNHATVNIGYLIQPPDAASAAAGATVGDFIALNPVAGGFNAYVIDVRTNTSAQVRHS